MVRIDLVRLKYILDVRDFPDSPYRDLFVKDFGAIENDHEVDIVSARVVKSRAMPAPPMVSTTISTS